MPGLHQLRLEAQTFYRLATERSDILASNGYKKVFVKLKEIQIMRREKNRSQQSQGEIK